MLAPRSSSRPTARLAAVLALMVAALLLAGCAQVAGTARTIKALEDMGIRQTATPPAPSCSASASSAWPCCSWSAWWCW